MIYPTVGASIFVHLIVVAVGKISNFLGIETKNNFKNKISVAKKIFLSFYIAIILEFVLLFVFGSAAFAIYASATSNKSNFNMIKNFYTYETKKLTEYCPANKICYIKNNMADALNIPIG